MYTAEQEMSLTSDLLYALGIDINKGNNILIDQDTGNPLLFENKSIKASRDPSKPVYISDNDIKLEPANPKCTKMLQSLFGFFLEKEERAGEIPHALSYYFDDAVKHVQIDKKTEIDVSYHRLVVKYADGSYYYGNWYKNKGIGYCEAILGIDGSFPPRDLNLFDIEDNYA